MEKLCLDVLVVDDSRADALLFQALLAEARSSGVRVTHVLSASDAIDAIFAEDYDAIFLDYQLGDASGLDVIRTIRGAGHDMPIIALSGCGSEDVATEALRLGAQDYLIKANLTSEIIDQSLQRSIDAVAARRSDFDKHATLSEFVRLVSHDLQSPLRQINALLAALRNDLSDRLESNEGQQIDELQETSQRMQRLLSDLLNYSLATSSPKTFASTSLDDALATALDALAPTLKEAGARVESRGLPLVQGDPTLLAQLFHSIIENAIKFRSAHSLVIAISSIDAGDCHRVSVTDNGIGFDDAHSDDVFKPLVRLHESRYEGSGIGLASCKRIIAQHQGEIHAKSSPDKGTTITFTLPAVVGEPLASDQAVDYAPTTRE